jgi:hypothetical protein
VYYNFGRIHKTLRVTPAVAAGLTDHVWTLEELAGLMEANEVPKNVVLIRSALQLKDIFA